MAEAEGVQSAGVIMRLKTETQPGVALQCATNEK